MFRRKHIVPLITSIGTLFSGVGMLWFGNEKILRYIFHDEVPEAVKLSVCVVLMASSAFVIAETRIPATFREYLRDKPAVEPLNEIGINPIVEASPLSLAPCQQRGYPIVVNVLKGMGLASIFCASFSSFVGTITFFELLGGDPTKQNYSHFLELGLQSLMYAGGVLFVWTKFHSGYCFAFTTTKKSAENTSKWLFGIEQEHSRLEAIKNYLVTFGLSAFNILSAPLVAYYSTEQTLLKIPYLCEAESFIHAFSTISALCSLTNDILSKSPAVRKTFEAWWYQHEEGSTEITCVYQTQSRAIRTLNIMMTITGAIDSLGTGANNMIAVINVLNKFFGWDRYAKGLISFSALCGLSAALVSAAYSVRRGHRAFIKNEVYNYFLEKNYLPLVVVDSKVALLPNDNLKDIEVKKITSLASEARASSLGLFKSPRLASVTLSPRSPATPAPLEEDESGILLSF